MPRPSRKHSEKMIVNISWRLLMCETFSHSTHHDDPFDFFQFAFSLIEKRSESEIPVFGVVCGRGWGGRKQLWNFRWLCSERRRRRWLDAGGKRRALKSDKHSSIKCNELSHSCVPFLLIHSAKNVTPSPSSPFLRSLALVGAQVVARVRSLLICQLFARSHQHVDWWHVWLHRRVSEVKIQRMCGPRLTSGKKFFLSLAHWPKYRLKGRAKSIINWLIDLLKIPIDRPWHSLSLSVDSDFRFITSRRVDEARAAHLQPWWGETLKTNLQKAKGTRRAPGGMINFAT